MTPEELNKAVEELKASGNTEEEILGSFYKMFQDDKLTLDELDGVVNLMGWHLTDEFKAMSPEDQKTKGYEEVDEDEQGVENEEMPEGKELTDDGKEVVDEDEPEESDEEKEAMKLFVQNK